jgi:hypothetical protein
MSTEDNARAHYRVVYPVAARPVFREFGAAADHTVADCSERGLRYFSGEGRTPSVGAAVEGTIVFPDGSEVRVAGVVVRTWQQEVALHLSTGPIPFPTIIAQQRFLRQQFPLNELMA